MALVEMTKLKIVGLKSERNKIMHSLIRSGLFEACKSGKTEYSFEAEESRLGKLTAKQVKVSFAVGFLKNIAEEVTAHNKLCAKKGLLDERIDPCASKKGFSRRLISFDDFSDCAAKEYELLSKVDALEQISFERVELKSQRTKIKTRLKALKPFTSCPLKFSDFADTKNTFSLLLLKNVKLQEKENLGLDVPVVTERYSDALTGIVGLKTDREKILAALAENGYTVCPFTQSETASGEIEKLIAQLKESAFRETEILKKASDYFQYLSEMETLYDVIGLEMEKTEAEINFLSTKSSFVAEGWVPKEESENLIGEIKVKTDKVVAYVLPPEQGDEPPTLLKNNRVVRQFEEVTNLYSVPGYGESDPNPFMWVFYFVFFGMIMADAGYGLIMSLAAALALKFIRFESATKKLVAMIGICGVSTIVWGILFGGLFGIEGIPALWFNPMENPILMFGLSLGLGAVQIIFGYGLYMAKMFKQKKYFAGIVDVVFIWLLFVGVGLILLNLLFNLSSGFMTAGIAVIVASLVGIVLTAGHTKKGVLSKITGGFAGLYNIVNLLSDVLSYARLFGLALASGAIALAFNTLGSLFFEIGVLGYILGFVLLVPLHIFNLALGLLSGYVHNARLQFIEFYGKFYDGGGRLFSPMGEKTKFVKPVGRAVRLK